MKAAAVCIITGAISVAGYALADRVIDHYDSPRAVCFRGVEYVQFPAGVVIERNTAGEIVRCNHE